MKTIGVIPARYASSRLFGKPLLDICGKPMLWWVYDQLSKVHYVDDVYVATDDIQIVNACKALGIKSVMTSSDHHTHIERVTEFASIVPADHYLVVCGDEPLVLTETMEKVFPLPEPSDLPFIRILMREFTDPVNVIDPSNIKIVVTNSGDCLFLSRVPIPFPYKRSDFTYKKIMGVECYNKAALDLFFGSPIGILESIEDITLLRFLENGIKMNFIQVVSDAISVDTQKDLDYARRILSGGLSNV